MRMVRTYNFIPKLLSFTLHIKILLMGDFKSLLPAMIEAVPARCNFIDNVLHIAPVITILYSDKQPATLAHKRLGFLELK